MLKQIRDFRKYSMITGLRRPKILKIDEILKTAKESPSDVQIQFFNGELVATWQHLYYAILNALSAFENECNYSKSLAMEIMLYASAQHQIRKATEMLGIKPGANMATVAIGNTAKAVRAAISEITKQVESVQDDSILDLTFEKKIAIRESFALTDTELDAFERRSNKEIALVNAIIERMALLPTKR